MGVNLTELMNRKQISIADLSEKVIVIDAQNHLYQFLSTIRAKDGSLLRDSSGNVTSHLTGLFARTTNLMSRNLKLAYVFDGKAPDLKRAEVERRVALKMDAQKKFEAATESENIEDMKKYASRTSRLTKEMIDEAKALLNALGIPCIQAPSEGEAQAAHMVRKGDAYAIASQDADALLFGADRVIRYLSVTGKKKLPGKFSSIATPPELITLKDTLHDLQINQDQLIVLSMLTGTDFNVGGIKGIGPRKALLLVKKHGTDFESVFSEVKWSESFNTSWKEVFETFKNMPVSDEYSLSWRDINENTLKEVLIDRHNFSKERIDKSIEELLLKAKKNKQQGLNKWF